MMKQFLVIAIAVSCPWLQAADELQLSPDSIQLDGRRDFQSVIVQRETSTGLTFDLTSRARLIVADESIARVEGNVVYPIADGKTELHVETDGQRLTAPLHVRKADDDSPMSFRLDVLPILSKAGCNSGRCHGSARGQDGFRLSLYGFDPAGDHFRLTREISGRRVNLARPAASLLLRKATGDVPHTGGDLLTADGRPYATLLRWLHEGAADDSDDIPHATGIEIYPRDAVLNGEGASQQLVVRARYSDDTTRDVTDLAVFLSNNDTSADVSETGLIRAGTRGEAFIMARFDTFTEGIPVITLPRDLDYEFPEVAEYNVIDTLVHRKLRRLRITPSDVCSDEEFLRRVFIDLAGITPDREQYEQFLNDDRPDRRERLVDHLLNLDSFLDLWAMRFGELLRIRTANQVSYKALLGFHHWVRDRLAADAPLNDIIRDVIAAEGGTFDNPPANYYQIEASTRQIAENVAQTFLGMRIQCAQCHNHPFDRWTMDDYYGFTAFFSRIGFKQSADPREFIVYSRDEGEVRHIVSDQVVTPKPLGGTIPTDADGSRRQMLADWVAGDENPYLAVNLANIIWAHHFSRGIVDPVDDVRISNPPSNAELLEELGRRLRDGNYQLRSLVRDICLSRTYQLSTRPNETNRDDFTSFSRAGIRRIRAEVLLDSISRITGTEDQFARLPAGARSVQIADGAVSNYFLSTFGRAPRETVCACEVDVEPSLSQAFHLLNGETTNDKILEGGLVARLLEQGQTPAEVLQHLYILCYSRLPTPEEQEMLLASLSEGTDPQQELNDTFWAILNSKEFIFNH